MGEKTGEGRERVGERKVGRDCAVLRIPLKKPWSWTLTNCERDRRQWLVVVVVLTAVFNCCRKRVFSV